jgi:hypothetical protein
MTTLGSLPVELVKNIIECLLVEDKDAPIVGENAASVDVFRWYKLKEASVASPSSPSEQISESEAGSQSTYELFTVLPGPLDEDEDELPVYSLKNLRL